METTFHPSLTLVPSLANCSLSLCTLSLTESPPITHPNLRSTAARNHCRRFCRVRSATMRLRISRFLQLRSRSTLRSLVLRAVRFKRWGSVTFAEMERLERLFRCQLEATSSSLWMMSRILAMLKRDGVNPSTPFPLLWRIRQPRGRRSFALSVESLSWRT